MQVEEVGGASQGAGGAVGVQRLQVFRAVGEGRDGGDVGVVPYGVPRNLREQG
ncbi:hypothetical protein [Streptomyces venezuelae]|uniref:hypothetical protein n=1 Tax=Streptomyces venezuelae TaxID=54571 RepID=UPI0037B8FCD9